MTMRSRTRSQVHTHTHVLRARVRTVLEHEQCAAQRVSGILLRYSYQEYRVGQMRRHTHN